ncbi:MAG TPA: hypothetical protein VFR24_00155 [Candidatus Angelobacter sp.]|nr:hypothetical protein [Candidatus Angelobacter sp.]
MLAILILMFTCGLVGFGFGRVKNAKKLAAAHAELNSLEAKATADAKTVIAAIRSKL